MSARLELATPRLRLLALTPGDLDRLLSDPGRLETGLGMPIARGVLTGPVMSALHVKAMKMTGTPPRDHPWYTYWLVVIRSVPVGAGLAGFKGAPNAAGEVEIGYGIAPEYQRQGYTTEAVRALLDWAFAQTNCEVVTAETRRDNAPSIRVLQKVGMQIFSQSEQSYFWRMTHPVEKVGG